MRGYRNCPWDKVINDDLLVLSTIVLGEVALFLTTTQSISSAADGRRRCSPASDEDDRD